MDTILRSLSRSVTNSQKNQQIRLEYSLLLPKLKSNFESRSNTKYCCYRKKKNIKTLLIKNEATGFNFRATDHNVPIKLNK
jgi:hypothetical protein